MFLPQLAIDYGGFVRSSNSLLRLLCSCSWAVTQVANCVASQGKQRCKAFSTLNTRNQLFDKCLNKINPKAETVWGFVTVWFYLVMHRTCVIGLYSFALLQNLCCLGLYSFALLQMLCCFGQYSFPCCRTCAVWGCIVLPYYRTCAVLGCIVLPCYRTCAVWTI